MKISFVLPNNSDHPIGGYKVIYEYANMFASNGDDVTINFTLYDRVPNKCVGLRGVLGKIKRNILYHVGILVEAKKNVTWYLKRSSIKGKSSDLYYLLWIFAQFVLQSLTMPAIPVFLINSSHN